MRSLNTNEKDLIATADNFMVEMGLPTYGDLHKVIELAYSALRNSVPTQGHYPEPVKRHADALAAATLIVEAA